MAHEGLGVFILADFREALVQAEVVVSVVADLEDSVVAVDLGLVAVEHQEAGNFRKLYHAIVHLFLTIQTSIFPWLLSDIPISKWHFLENVRAEVLKPLVHLYH